MFIIIDYFYIELQAQIPYKHIFNTVQKDRKIHNKSNKNFEFIIPSLDIKITYIS